MYGFNNYQFQQQDDRIWVQNEQAAQSYLVAPNSFVRLWSASEPVFYEKRADQNGRPFPMDVFEYSQRRTQAVSTSSLTVDHKDDLKALNDRLEALERRINEHSESNAADPTV